MQNLYKYQYNRVRAGKCYLCEGSGVKYYDDGFSGDAYTRDCNHCKGSGTPTVEDLEKAELYDKRICGHCTLPMLPAGNPTIRIDTSFGNDCLDHALQRIAELEERIMKLEATSHPAGWEDSD